MVVPYQLKGLTGEQGKLESVTVASICGSEERVIEADILLPFFGLAAKLGSLEDWGLDIEHNRILTAQASSGTIIPGIFAAGDIASYKGKLRLILTGFAEAAQAAHSAFHLIHPDMEMHFEYSTSKGLPK
jgi:thioredoxin reductase (NADPH)